MKRGPNVNLRITVTLINLTGLIDKTVNIQLSTTLNKLTHGAKKLQRLNNTDYH